ncbi:MAG: N-acetylmuramoyl-L-alanine amidase [Propioniciclava sp.]
MRLARRSVLLGAAGVALTPRLAVATPGSRPEIRPRSTWAQGRRPVGRLTAETDVRFLLIHHTATTNDYSADAATAQLRSVFDFHTSAHRGWPDVAYNFLVDRYGTIWEGRQGSIAGPVAGDASGGSQGFAQLCCFLGDFSQEKPSAAATAAMTNLIAWLSVRDGIDPGAEVTFTSRGSSRWPEGEKVTTTAVAGHRDMSLTECPGDAAYPLIASTLTPNARRLVAARTASATPRTTTATPDASTSPTAEPSATSSVRSGRSTPLWADVLGIGGIAAALLGAAAVVPWRRFSGEQHHQDEQETEPERDTEADEEPPHGE